MNNVWACLCAGDILLRREGDTISLPVGDEPPVEVKPWNLITTLKLEVPSDPAITSSSLQPDAASSSSYPAASVPDASPSGRLHVVRLDRPVTGTEHFEMLPLRASFDVLSAEEYALAGKAAELIYWDANSKFCGCCGAPMKFETDISKRCTNCGKELWPQLATAVIVRVTAEGGSAILLVHANNFRRPYYGLVAGFVETGETLEEAVQREVREETGLQITNIRYFGSQPWPYPCGLMVGFTADYVSGDIHLQRSELSSGGWFTRDNMPPIPGKSSIARRLIDDWLKQDNA